MISIESASTSNLGASFSRSDVMLANGDAIEGGVGVAAGDVVELHRLWMVPCLKCRADTCIDVRRRKHVKARLVIIEISSFGYESNECI